MIQPVLDLPLLLFGAVMLLALVVIGLLRSPRSERWTWIRRGLVVLLVTLVALRPALGSTEAPRATLDLEVVVAVDRTASMSALDWWGDQPRLDGVRRDVQALADALPGARFSLVSFAGSTRTELPSTKDATLFVDSVKVLKREEPWVGIGTSLDEPIPELRAALSRIEDQHPDRRRVLVLMSDGESTAGGKRASYEGLEPLVDAGLVLGYGTGRGGRMPLTPGVLNSPSVPDPETGEAAVSRLDSVDLRAVAGELGVRYLHRTRPNSFEGLLADWERDLAVTTEPDSRPADREVTWLLALLLLLALAPELRLQWRRAWQAAREMA